LEILLLVLLLAPVIGVIAIGRNQRQRSALRSATASIVVDERGVRRTLADGRVEQVDWVDVMEVDVFTTDVGPHKDAGGAVVLYGDDTRGCIVPLDRLGDSGLLQHVHRLPGFPLRVLLDAVGAGGHKAAVRSAPSPLTRLAPKPLQRTTSVWKRPVADESEPTQSEPTQREPDEPEN
jgi:hypothetical protein